MQITFGPDAQGADRSVLDGEPPPRLPRAVDDYSGPTLDVTDEIEKATRAPGRTWCSRDVPSARRVPGPDVRELAIGTSSRKCWQSRTGAEITPPSERAPPIAAATTPSATFEWPTPPQKRARQPPATLIGGPRRTFSRYSAVRVDPCTLVISSRRAQRRLLSQFQEESHSYYTVCRCQRIGDGRTNDSVNPFTPIVPVVVSDNTAAVTVAPGTQARYRARTPTRLTYVLGNREPLVSRSRIPTEPRRAFDSAGNPFTLPPRSL